MKKLRNLLSIMVSVIMITSFCLTATDLSVAFAADESTAKVVRLKTDSMINPIGIDSTNPYFSWQMEDDVRGQKQTAYRILVAKSDEKLNSGEYVWDSGKVESDDSAYIEYKGTALESSTRYYWKVELTDASNKTAVSDTSYFETGLMDSGWNNAEWIGKSNTQDDSTTESSPMFRKEFNIPDGKTVESARAYATATGLYELYLNGKCVTEGTYLNPGMTQYDDHILYQTYDITDMVKNGQNAVGAQLGHGWFTLRYYGTTLRFYSKILIKYTDGTSDTVVTDNSWKSYRHGPLLSDDLYDGHQFDAQIEKQLGDWKDADYDDSKWESVTVTDKTQIFNYPASPQIMAQDMPLIKNVKTLDTVTMTEPEKGVYVYDFGQNIAGIPYIKASAAAGTKMTIQYGEIINTDELINKDGAVGTVYTKNLINAKATDTYVFSGDGTEIFEPKFTYHGFRYLEITGLSEPIPAENVKAMLLMTDMEETGSFECSDEFVTQLYLNALWSERDNFLSAPTDCPQRSERYGWTGDAQIIARAASYNMDINAFYKNYCMDMRDASTDNKIIPDAAPASFGPGWFGQGDRKEATNGWGDAIVIIPYEMYMQYGNKEILKENYEIMCNWVNYLVETSGDDYIRDESWTGDWLPVLEAKSPIALTDTAFCAYSAKLLSRIASILGYGGDSAKYSELYDKYRTAWREKFLEDDGCTTKCGSQTSYVLGLKFGLFDEDEISGAAENLVKNIKEHGWHLTTGFLGLSYLNPMLSDNGYSDVAYKLLEQKEYPSWLYSVVHGSTTIWESWSSMRFYNDGTSMMQEDQSLNHYSYGSVCEWMYRYMLGIDRDENSAGFKHFLLKPEIGGSITSAKGSYNSISGNIKSAWEVNVKDGSFTYTATVPANTTATLYLPVKSDSTEVLEGNVKAENSEGIQSKGYKDGCMVYGLESGNYTFKTTVNTDYNDRAILDIKNPQQVTASMKIGDTEYNSLEQNVIADSANVPISVTNVESGYEFKYFTDNDGNIYENNSKISGQHELNAVFAYVGSDDGKAGNKKITVNGDSSIEIEVNGVKHNLPYSESFEKGSEVTIKVTSVKQFSKFSGFDGIKTAGDTVCIKPYSDVTTTAITEDIIDYIPSVEDIYNDADKTYTHPVSEWNPQWTQQNWIGADDDGGNVLRSYWQGEWSQDLGTLTDNAITLQNLGDTFYNSTSANASYMEFKLKSPLLYNTLRFIPNGDTSIGDFTYTFNPGEWYVVRFVENTNKNQIDVYVNDKLQTVWKSDKLTDCTTMKIEQLTATNNEVKEAFRVEYLKIGITNIPAATISDEPKNEKTLFSDVYNGEQESYTYPMENWTPQWANSDGMPFITNPNNKGMSLIIPWQGKTFVDGTVTDNKILLKDLDKYLFNSNLDGKAYVQFDIEVPYYTGIVKFTPADSYGRSDLGEQLVQVFEKGFSRPQPYNVKFVANESRNQIDIYIDGKWVSAWNNEKLKECTSIRIDPLVDTGNNLMWVFRVCDISAGTVPSVMTKDDVTVNDSTVTVAPQNANNGTKFIVAAYNNGIMSSIDIKSYNGENMTFKISDEYDKIKVFAFESMTNIKPLCNAVEISNQ